MANNPLLQYLQNIPVKKREELAERAGSSPTSLRLAAHGYKTGGKLSITAEFAARIEEASDGALARTQLADVCCACPHVKCKSKKRK